ncbi:MAG: radical SAM family heme chaperone HemW [Chloroflexi bacterium]|nr:radical SAM family heme chaperone HemW [Chloroflexota bacterium]
MTSNAIGSEEARQGQQSHVPLALYIHVPFCATRCSYCDFNTYTGLGSLMPGYVDALCTEVQGWGTALGRAEVSTIFFGGGTPSQLTVEQVGRILDACRASFCVQGRVEVTLEANPDDVTPSYAAGLLDVGVNRLSMGVQSFNDALLRLVGRRHTAHEAKTAYKAARRAGFASINLDFIYALPGQPMDDWRSTIEQAVDLSPEHLSLYALTLEEETPLWRAALRGRIRESDPDLAADMYELAQDMMGEAGYRHYEVSNWSRPGHECRHNLVYWRNGPYLGFGPGAHGCYGGFRYSITRSPKEYVRWLAGRGAASPAPVAGFDEAAMRVLSPIDECRPLSFADEASETIILGLRLAQEGVVVRALEQRFGSEAMLPFERALSELTALGLVERTPERLRLTRRGLLLSNEVFWRLLPSETAVAR